MLLYFTNNSKQNKILLETDYVEDIYDEILTFFEEYHIYPHYVKVEPVDRTAYQYVGKDYQMNYELVCRISFGSYSEFFYCEGIMNVEELRLMFEPAESNHYYEETPVLQLFREENQKISDSDKN